MEEERELGCKEMKKEKKEKEKLGLRVNMYFFICVFLMGCVGKQRGVNKISKK